VPNPQKILCIQPDSQRLATHWKPQILYGDALKAVQVPRLALQTGQAYATTQYWVLIQKAQELKCKAVMRCRASGMNGVQDSENLSSLSWLASSTHLHPQ